MNKLVLCVLAMGVALVLASCATLTQEQCVAGDWRAVGFEDGAEGRPAGYVSNHIDACSEYGIGLDRTLYDAGRTDGLETYCRLSTAEAEGREGERYYNVCTGEIGIAFSRVHAAADAVHDVETDIATLDSEIDSQIDQLTRSDLTEEQRALVSLQLRTNQSRRATLNLRLSLAERNLATIRRTEELRLSSAGLAY